MNDPDLLNRQFAIPNIAKFEAGDGGLTRLSIKSDLAEAEIYLHGAHVTRFVPAGAAPVLFMSKKSNFTAGKAIRGGVPICFPWFGAKADDSKAPAHGFARLMEWTVASVASTPAGVATVFTLSSSEETKRYWPADFLARYTVTVSTALELSLAVTNTGKTAVKFEEALHSYFAISDINTIRIDGLSGTTYLDKMNNAARTQQGESPIAFTGETDRVYLDTRSTCIVHDPTLARQIHNAKSGSTSTVVWNPWIAKARAMADFGDDEWPGMVCVETCNLADSAVSLAPGATHAMTAKISVSP